MKNGKKIILVFCFQMISFGFSLNCQLKYGNVVVNGPLNILQRVKLIK